MAIIAVVSNGKINVGPSGNPTHTTTLTHDGGTVVADAKGRIKLATGEDETFTMADMLKNVSKLSFVHLKGVDSSGDPSNFSISWDANATPDIDECSEFTWAVKVAAVTGVASIKVTNLSGADQFIEYVLAGQ